MLIVDDNRPFREETAALLSREPDIEVVGRAASANEAMALATRLRPCVVLMDVALPDRTGIEVTRWLKRLPHPPAVLILTLHGDAPYRAAAAAAGADAFLCKSDFAADLPACVRLVACDAARTGSGERDAG